jgi:hypothetical protein
MGKKGAVVAGVKKRLVKEIWLQKKFGGWKE